MGLSKVSLESLLAWCVRNGIEQGVHRGVPVGMVRP